MTTVRQRCRSPPTLAACRCPRASWTKKSPRTRRVCQTQQTPRRPQPGDPGLLVHRRVKRAVSKRATSPCFYRRLFIFPVTYAVVASYPPIRRFTPVRVLVTHTCGYVSALVPSNMGFGDSPRATSCSVKRMPRWRRNDLILTHHGQPRSVYTVTRFIFFLLLLQLPREL